MLKVVNFGQNEGTYGPDIALAHDPGVDNPALTNAGYIGGRLVAIKTSSVASRGNVVVPCDAATMIPVGFLLNGAGENSGAIGPSGSGKIAYVRAMPKILVDATAYVASPVLAYTVGLALYCGSGANAGKLTSDKPTATGSYATPVGTITDIPSASFPWLGLDSLL